MERLAARELRSPAICSQIAYLESRAFSRAQDSTERPTGFVDSDRRVWYINADFRGRKFVNPRTEVGDIP